jgi:hypothetical protein
VNGEQREREGKIEEMRGKPREVNRKGENQKEGMYIERNREVRTCCMISFSFSITVSKFAARLASLPLVPSWKILPSTSHQRFENWFCWSVRESTEEEREKRERERENRTLTKGRERERENRKRTEERENKRNEKRSRNGYRERQMRWKRAKEKDILCLRFSVSLSLSCLTSLFVGINGERAAKKSPSFQRGIVKTRR